MNTGDAMIAQQLRQLGDKAHALARELEQDALWPGQLVDGLRAIITDVRTLERAVEESRPRISRGRRW